jgi:hypothetical protein
MHETDGLGFTRADFPEGSTFGAATAASAGQIDAARRAVAEGVPLAGHFVWSLLCGKRSGSRHAPKAAISPTI